ncbi:MAG: HAMP domain-containing histidine kinase [Microbacteriaceae bacterium]|nr:HAMP domain-containing histidine kinase [Microbacteriaceae bacterium]MCL2794266.1 HAMP domain-containing histidine kinase [Microbacteriaceae bacterium]
MTTEADSLRGAARRLALRFTGLIVALFLVMAAVIVTLVAVTEREALVQQLLSAEHIDSPSDAPPGVYVAIQQGDGMRVSDNAPAGFPDADDIRSVTASGGPVQETRTFDGEAFIVRTDGDSGRVVQVAVNRQESQAELRRVLLALAIAAIPTIGGAALLGWWMSMRAMRPLADALAMQRRFVADAGHELRTPLTLLSTRAQLLRRTAAPSAGNDEVVTGLDEIVADAKALTGILEDLLIAADPRRDAERVAVDLGGLAAESVTSLRAEAASRGVALELEADAGVTVLGVRVSLARVVVALVSNALDHAVSRVLLSARAQGEWAVLDVRDDGPGFPPGVAERAFERFASTRSGDESEAGRRHYGLGLALVAEVAHRHGGDVAIVGAPEGGAVVRVRLPLRPAA